jgi:hypothetical protein
MLVDPFTLDERDIQVLVTQARECEENAFVSSPHTSFTPWVKEATCAARKRSQQRPEIENRCSFYVVETLLAWYKLGWLDDKAVKVPNATYAPLQGGQHFGPSIRCSSAWRSNKLAEGRHRGEQETDQG